MYLPTSLDLSRLRFYSPFIKRLDIPLTTTIGAYTNWDGFLAATESVDLLPNLEHLKLAVPERMHRETISKETFYWTLAFLSSSLLSLQIYPEVAWEVDVNKVKHTWIGLDYTTQLLQRLSEKCHRLSSLTILAGNITVRAEMFYLDLRFAELIEATPARSMFWSTSLGLDSIIPRFNHLRKLSTTPLILDLDAFKALGKLPVLESLSIRDVQRDHELQGFANDPILTEDAFPSLQRLELLDITYDTVINICKQRRLAQALHSLKPTVVWSNVNIGENKLAPLLRILDEHDSPISRLYLSCIPAGWQLFPHSAEHLSRLNLVHLSIPQPDGSNYELSQLTSALPVLKLLEFNQWMSGNDLPLGVLRRLAELLPNLSRLSIPLKFSSASQLREQDFVPHSPQSLEPFCLESKFDDEDPMYGRSMDDPTSLAKYTKKIARYLNALWPNVECKAKQFLDEVEDLTEIDQLNDLLSYLRNHSIEPQRELGQHAFGSYEHSTVLYEL